MALQREWIFEQCLSHQGAQHDFKTEWEADRFLVGGKMFAMLGGDKEGTPILTLKAEPAAGELLRAEFADIVPGYYMNKQHWNSIYLAGVVPEDVAAGMIAASYRLVLEGFSKKRQAAICTGEETV